MSMIRAAKPFSNFPAKVLYPQLPAAWHKFISDNEEHLPAQWLPFFSFSPGWVFFPPSQVNLYTETLLGPHDALAYGSILQTHMPFMTHVTRCPVVPTALLCAARVDVSTNCRTGKNLKLCVGLVKHKYHCAGACLDILYILRIMHVVILVLNLSESEWTCQILVTSLPAKYWQMSSASWGCWFATNGYSCALKMVMTCNVWWILGLQETIWIGFFHNTSRQISHKKTPELGCCESTSAILSVAVHNFIHTGKKTYEISRWTAFRMSKVSPHSEAAWWKLNIQFLTFKGGKKNQVWRNASFGIEKPWQMRKFPKCQKNVRVRSNLIFPVQNPPDLNKKRDISWEISFQWKFRDIVT